MAVQRLLSVQRRTSEKKIPIEPRKTTAITKKIVHENSAFGCILEL